MCIKTEILKAKNETAENTKLNLHTRSTWFKTPAFSEDRLSKPQVSNITNDDSNNNNRKNILTVATTGIW